MTAIPVFAKPFGIMAPVPLSGSEATLTAQLAAVGLSTPAPGLFRPGVGSFADNAGLARPDITVATAAGYSLFLTVRPNGTGTTASTYPADEGAYITGLETLLDTYQPALVALMNEALGPFWSDSLALYGDLLELSHPSCAARNIPMVGSGCVGGSLMLLCAKHYYDAGDSDTALDIMREFGLLQNIQIVSRQQMEAQFTALASSITDAEEYIAIERALVVAGKLDGANLHSYVKKTPSVWPTILTYFKSLFPAGTPMVTNETGAHNLRPAHVTSMLVHYYTAGFRPIIWYSQDINSPSTGAPRARSLFLDRNAAGRRPGGQAFKSTHARLVAGTCS